MIRSLLRSAACGLAFAAAVAGSFAIAQTITKSVQLSQDPSGPYGVDTVNNLVLTGNRHLNSIGQSPVVSGCGTGPTIVGTDFAGIVVAGTGAITTCTITFAQPYTTTPPRCVVSLANTTNAGPLFSIATTTTLVANYASEASDSWTYICIGT